MKRNRSQKKFKSRRSKRRRTSGTISAMLLVFSLSIFSWPEIAIAQDNREKWDMTPYRVLVTLSFDSSLSTRTPLREEIRKDIRDRLNRSFGKMWQVTVEDRHSFAEVGSGGLTNLDEKKVLDWFPENNPKSASIPVWDKVFFAHLNFRASNLVATCREWDALSRTLSSIEHQVTTNPHRLAQSMVTVIEKTFRPVISINRTDNLDVYASVKAGTISTLDPNSAQLKKDDVILPFFRYLDKEQNVKKIQVMPWTYLIVDEVEQSFVESTLIAGIRSPLGTNRRRRVQLLGLKMNRKRNSGTLKLVLRSVRTEPMIGMRVEVAGKRQYRDKTERPPEKFFSNRRGEVKIPVDDKHPVVWVYVYSGSALVARVPFAPGREDEKLLAIKDDSIRLRMEGEVELLLGELVDVIAQRSALAAQAKTYARNNKIKEADQKLEEIAELRGIEEFTNMRKMVLQHAMDDAKAVKNKWAIRRINELDVLMMRMVTEFLNPAKIEEIRNEVEEIKSGKSESK